MIVKDEESIEQAIQMLATSPEGVRYSDQYAYIVITASETLEYQCKKALERNDIAVVVPRGDEAAMENYAQELLIVRKQRAMEEKQKIKEWVVDHPEAVAKIKKRMK